MDTGLEFDMSINICLITNNLGSTKDGIGNYADNLRKALEDDPRIQRVFVFAPRNIQLNKLFWFISPLMSIATLLCTYKIVIRKVDKIVIEYPFTEYNPLILFFTLILRFVSKMKGTKIILSLHEYRRVKYFRKLIIRILIKLSDNILLSSNSELLEISSFVKNKGIFLREIPSNISVNKQLELCNLHKKGFVFFGLWDKRTKALEQLLEGWRLFVEKNNYTSILTILTSSDIHVSNLTGVEIHCNLRSDEVSDVLAKKKFMIIPIKPYISYNNGTLKAGTLHGCIPIGVFDGCFLESDLFSMKMDNYSALNFKQIFEKCESLNSERSIELMNGAIQFGNRFSFEKIVQLIVDL